MITKLRLKNFTAFKELKIDFSSKVNVIIGENGTGKTHLLKAAYAVCEACKPLNAKDEVSTEDIQNALTPKLINVFKPLDDKLWKLRMSGATEPAEVETNFVGDKRLILSFNVNSVSVQVTKNNRYERYSYEPVFIPTKEVLSFMKGFASLYEKYELSFDETYQDMCRLLDLPEMRRENLQPKAQWAMSEIERISGGKFVFQGGGRVTFKEGAQEYSANAMAEGFRKAGMLYRLLETGAIQPGVSGPLFWDEPEANLNPKLMELLVQILLELSRNGQQIIVATHDYMLLKWFDLLSDKGKEDHVRFHVLYRDADSGEIKIESTDEYLRISPNAISEAFNDLTKQQVKKTMGDLGK